MKHKFIALLMGLSLLLTITGCSKQTAEEPVSPNVQTESSGQENPSEETIEPDTAERTETEDDLSNESLPSDMTKIRGTITSADESEIVVDNQSENASAGEMILTVDFSQNTVLDAVTGFPVTPDEIQPGSFEAYIGAAMTMSLPPQTNPYMVIVNIPEDAQAPQYIAASEQPVTENGVMMIKATDGNNYQIPEDAEIIPFLTRNIVRLDDITEGSRCLIWQDEDGVAKKVVLFQ